jgi:hypothetical protein
MSDEVKLPKLDPDDRPDRDHLYDKIELSTFDGLMGDADLGTALILKPDVRSNWEVHLTASESDAFKNLEVGVQLSISLSTDPFEALWRIIGG